MQEEWESMSFHGEGTCVVKFSGDKASETKSFLEMEVSSSLPGYACITK